MRTKNLVETNATTTILSIDIDYSYTKALTPGTTPFLAPSLAGPAKTIRYESNVVAQNSKGITVKLAGRWYSVGEHAELQSASASQTLDAIRTGSAEQKALFCAAVSELPKTTISRVAEERVIRFQTARVTPDEIREVVARLARGTLPSILAPTGCVPFVPWSSLLPGLARRLAKAIRGET